MLQVPQLPLTSGMVVLIATDDGDEMKMKILSRAYDVPKGVLHV